MRSRKLHVAAILISLLTSVSQAQIQLAEPQAKLVISGIENSQLVGDLLLLPIDSTLKTNKGAIVPVTTEASVVSVRASDQKRNAIEVTKTGETSAEGKVLHEFLVVATGKVWFEVTAIDFEKRLFSQEVFVVDLGAKPDDPDVPDPNPGPDPDVPDPDVPPDAWDNLGQRVAVWAAGLPINKKVGEVYREASISLKTDPTVTVNQVSSKLVGTLEAMSGADAYKEMRTNINADLQQRWSIAPLSKGALATYFAAIATGLGVTQ